METQKQKDAAFAKVHPELVDAIRKYVPLIYQQEIINTLNTPDAVADVRRVLEDAYAAEEAAE